MRTAVISILLLLAAWCGSQTIFLDPYRFEAAPAAASSFPMDGLLAYWKFDDNSGTNAVDSSGNNRTGTLVGSPTWTNGVINSSLYFGGSARVSVSGFALATNLTVAMWAWIPSGIANDRVMMSQWVGTGNRSFTFSSGNPPGLVYCAFYRGNDTATSVAMSGGSAGVITNQWIHLVATYDGVAARLFTNGVFAAQTSGAGTNVITTADISIGARATAVNFTGFIDEPAIWGRALSTNEVSQLYNDGAGLQP